MKETMYTPCSEWVEKLAAGHPDDLSPMEQAGLDTHLASCSACAAVQKEYQAMRANIHELRTIDPPPELAGEILHLWEEQNNCLGIQATVPSAYDSGSTFTEDIEAFYPFVLALARQEVPGNIGPVDSEDIAQEAFIKLLLILQKQPIANPKAYIRRIVHTVVVDMLRRYKPNFHLPLPVDEDGEIQVAVPGIAPSDPEAFVEQKELEDELLTCLANTVARLHPRQQRAMICTLRDRFDEFVQRNEFVQTLLEIDIIDKPQRPLSYPFGQNLLKCLTKVDRQRSQASHSPARRRTSQ